MLEQTLDETRLNGPHSVLINVRPSRAAAPVNVTDMPALIHLMAQICQIWGGANSPIIPATPEGSIDPHYSKILAGSAIDRIWGLDVFGLYHLPTSRVDFIEKPFGWGSQLAVALLNYRTQE